MSPLHDFSAALFHALLSMDAEAVPSAEGYPTGLNWYGKYRHSNHVKPQTEPSWTQRLTELLTRAGYEAHREQQYPDLPGCSARNLCDNIVVQPDRSVLWFENKGAWKEYWRQRGELAKFNSHLLKSENSALHDLAKISPLCTPHAQWLGFLLLGFDSAVAPMDADVDEFARLAQIRSSPWLGASMHWPDRWREGQRVHAWFWWRPATVT